MIDTSTDEVRFIVSNTVLDGHISLPNGYGLDGAGVNKTIGVTTNELTSTDDRDSFVGTPGHKSVPARLESV